MDLPVPFLISLLRILRFQAPGYVWLCQQPLLPGLRLNVSTATSVITLLCATHCPKHLAGIVIFNSSSSTKVGITLQLTGELTEASRVKSLVQGYYNYLVTDLELAILIYKTQKLNKFSTSSFKR